MIVGDPAVFAIESGITNAYQQLGFRALGYFAIHVGGRRYGVVAPDATLLACSFEEVGERIARRGEHTAPFANTNEAITIATAFQSAIYFDEQDESYFGIPLSGFCKLIFGHHLQWAPDGDEAFDDGSSVLHFDIEDRVRLIAYHIGVAAIVDLPTLKEVSLSADEFYRILQEWHDAFEEEWRNTPKSPE